MYEKYIDEFMPSKDMRDYLKTQELTPNQIAELIYKSPISIDKKLSAFMSLKDETDNEELIELCQVVIELINKANDALSYDSAMTVHLESFRGDWLEYMKGNKNCQASFMQREKPVKDENGKDKRVFFYTVNNELCYFDFALGIDEKGQYPLYNSDLRIPAPFEVGDILQFYNPIDGSYAYSIVLHNNKVDGYSLNNLFRSLDGEWHTGSVARGRTGFDREYGMCFISPFYHVKLYSGDLPDEYRILKELSTLIKLNEENVFIVDKIFEATRYRTLTENKLRRIIERGE